MGGAPGEARLRTAVVGLVVVLICCGALGIAGLGVEDRLEPTSLIVPGTTSARGQALAEEHFGRLLAVRGPAARTGRGDRPAGPGAGPGAAPRSAADRHLPLGPRRRRLPAPRPGPGAHPARLPPAARRRDARHRARARTHARSTGPPAGDATQSGYASVSRALQKESLSATERAELHRGAAAADRPPARLPLAGGGRDPARLRRAHRLRRPRRPRPARAR